MGKKRDKMHGFVVRVLYELLEDMDLVDKGFRPYYLDNINTNGAKHSRYIDTMLLIERLKVKGRLLDIGTTPGHLAIILRQYGFDVKGLDYDPARMKRFFKRHELEVKQCDLEKDKIPYKDNSFDVVLFTEVIEHLYTNQIDLLKEIYRIIDKNGVIILSTNHIGAITKLEYLLNYPTPNLVKAQKTFETIGSRGHVRFYSKSDLVGMLEYAGFKIKDIDYLGNRPLTFKQKIVTIFFPRSKKHSIVITGVK